MKYKCPQCGSYNVRTTPCCGWCLDCGANFDKDDLIEEEEKEAN